MIKTMTRILCVTALVALTAAHGQQAEKMKVAVLDFKGDGGAAIGDMVRNEFLRSGLFVIAERESIEKVVGEQQMQMTGMVDPSQAVEIGKLTAAKKLVTGSVGVVGDQVVMTVRVIDVESGAVELGDKVIAYSREDLASAAEELSRKIISKIAGREVQINGKSYFATASDFSEMKVLVVSVKKVVISAGQDSSLKKGDSLVVYIVKGNGKEQVKSLIKVKKVGEETTECQDVKKVNGMITASDLVRKLKPGEKY
jgi:TolB-like protein